MRFTDRARVLGHGVLASKVGDGLRPLRYARKGLAFANNLLGRPLRSAEEIARREAELKEALLTYQAAREKGAQAAPREAAPVIVYVTDQDHRTPRRIADILKGRQIPFTQQDITSDEVTQSWALTQAKAREFPLVFIAGEPAGGVDELMQLDVSGDLVRRVFGEIKPTR